MCGYSGRLKLRRTAEVRLDRQCLRGTRITATTAYKQKAPEGALCVSSMTQLPLPRQGSEALRLATSPRRSNGI